MNQVVLPQSWDGWNESIIQASELYRAGGKVLRRVAVDKQRLVVERDGYPVAVLVPYPEYKQERQIQARLQANKLMDELKRISRKQGLDNVSDEEAMTDALRAVREARRGKRRK
jgi:prevent-host-death family protein